MKVDGYEWQDSYSAIYPYSELGSSKHLKSHDLIELISFALPLILAYCMQQGWVQNHEVAAQSFVLFLDLIVG